MRFGFGHSDSESVRGGSSRSGSFRRSRTGVSPDRSSCVSTASKSIPYSKRECKALKEYSETVVDIELFSDCIEDWILKKLPPTCSDKKLLFRSPFVVDELQKLDYALEGVLFQQLLRMPSSHASDSLREEQFLALVDFLQTIVGGLWRTFWQKTGQPPFCVSCPRFPGSRFCTVEKAISNGSFESLSGAAVVANRDLESPVQWDHIAEMALFRSDITHGNKRCFSMQTIAEALFYGFHIILARNLSKLSTARSNSIHLLVLDSKFGGVIKFGGDISQLDVNSSNPYHSAVEWIKNHAKVYISPIDFVWNKLGNANWGDIGTLQLLLATYNSIVQWKGPPKMSIGSLAAEHQLSLQKRRMECYGLASTVQGNHSNKWDTMELEGPSNQTSNRQSLYLRLKQGEVILLEHSQGQEKFLIKDIIVVGDNLSYSVFSLDQPCRLFTLYIGVHPSRLEPSWEAMSLWYRVQRQTKVLNIMKQQGVSSKYLPEIVVSGRLSHPEACAKHYHGDTCDHPWCGTPALLTSPFGEAISSVLARDGPFSAEEALKLCRDILMSLSRVAPANLQHGDICPENIVRVAPSNCRTETVYVLASWGRAVVEDRDSPALNLQFSSAYALQHRKLCPSSDVESLIYLLYFVCGGQILQQDSIEAALRWRERCWVKRVIQHQLGEVSTLLKAFTDYADNLCGTPYPVDYDIWLRRLNRALSGKGKSTERVEINLRLEDFAESSGISGGGASFSY